MALGVPWQEALQDLFCLIYQAVGGDCDDLDWDGDGNEATVDSIIDLYRDHRDAGGFANSQEEQTFLSLIDDLEAHLAKPTNSADAALNSKMQGYIAEVRFDLGGAMQVTATHASGSKSGKLLGHIWAAGLIGVSCVIGLQILAVGEPYQESILGVLDSACLAFVAWRVGNIRVGGSRGQAAH